MNVPVASADVTSLFSERQRVQLYLKIEDALAVVQSELGIIPPEAAQEISAAAKIELIDLEKLRTDTAVTGYPIAPLVRQLAAQCPGAGADYVHWGATTQDIMDTALALQMTAAFDRLDIELRILTRALISLATNNRSTVMAGRTFGGHALPITFGNKAARWMSSCCRHLERIRQIKPRVSIGQFGGAVGTLSSLGAVGEEVRARLMIRLGLQVPLVTWHVARDSVAEAVCLLGIIMTTLGKLARDVFMLSSTEISELAEPTSGGRDASSTLPQKQNPIFSAQILAASQIVAQLVPTILNATQHDHERGPQGFVEDEIIPRCFILTLSSLASTNRIVAGLQIDPYRMQSNMNLSNDAIFAEPLMMNLASVMGRLRAHDVVHEAAMTAKQSGTTLVGELCKSPEVAKHLTRQKLNDLLNAYNNLGDAEGEIDRAIGWAQRILADTGANDEQH